MMKSREAISGMLIRFYLNGTFQRTKEFQFFNQFYFYLLGLVWLILMIVVENYFRLGVKKGDLFKRIGKVIGPELILLLVSDVFRLFSTTFSAQDWIIVFLELVLGAGMIWLAVSLKTPSRPGQVRQANL